MTRTKVRAPAALTDRLSEALSRNDSTERGPMKDFPKTPKVLASHLSDIRTAPNGALFYSRPMILPLPAGEGRGEGERLPD
jgi:hypothetical protein